ncbi:hypothetical protein [Flavobacterium sp.]|uniref:hypothetical protein n=1 Tax=Flavobacterium sp. TaxID=239 RepID=UPI003528C39E
MNNYNLHNPKIKPGFKTPDSYFVDFEATILTKIKKENDSRTKVLSLTQNKKLWYSGIAAVLTLLFCLTMVLKSNTATIDSIETASLESYLATEFSSYELAEKLNSDETIEFTDITDISNEAIETYFENNKNIEDYLTE